MQTVLQHQGHSSLTTKPQAIRFDTFLIIAPLAVLLFHAITINLWFEELSIATVKQWIIIAALVAGYFHLSPQIRSKRAAVNVRASILLPLTSLACALSIWWHTDKLELLCVLAMLSATLFTLQGKERTVLWLRPIFLAAFLVSYLPDEMRRLMCIPLQYASCTLTVWLAKPFVPIVQSGFNFLVDKHTYFVAPGCAGLNMWASFLFAFALWQVFIKYRPIAYLAALMLDPLLTLVLNSIRLFITALLAHFVNPQTALAVHSNLEFLLVPPGLLVLWWLGSKCRAKE